MNMRTLYFISIGFMPTMHAYLYQAVVLRKWHDVYDRYQYVIGLGDYHAKRHPANKLQREQLGEMLVSHTDGDALKVLTEDLSVANSNGRFGCGPFYVNSRGGFLGGITEQCRAYGIDADNLEFRYARVCALGPVLNNEHSLYSFPSVRSISVGQVCDEMYQECERIEQFDDGPIINAWYAASIQDVIKCADNFSLDKHRHKSMADYLSHKRKRLQLAKDLLTFDRCLLDARIVHAILEHQDKERICVIAGGSHIERVSEVLQKIGYQSLTHIKPLYHTCNDIQDAVILPMKDQQRPLPTPLDMHQLRKFFK